MLKNPFPVPSLCKLKYISICFIQISTKITYKQVIPFRESNVFLKVIPGVLSRLVNFKKVLLHTYFYNTSLNVLRPNFFDMYNLPFSRFLNIEKIRDKFGPKTNYFPNSMSCCINHETNKTVPAIFFFSNIF